MVEIVRVPQLLWPDNITIDFALVQTNPYIDFHFGIISVTSDVGKQVMESVLGKALRVWVKLHR